MLLYLGKVCFICRMDGCPYRVCKGSDGTLCARLTDPRFWPFYDLLPELCNNSNTANRNHVHMRVPVNFPDNRYPCGYQHLPAIDSWRKYMPNFRRFYAVVADKHGGFKGDDSRPNHCVTLR